TDDRANQSPIHAHLLPTGASCRADRFPARYVRKRAGGGTLAAGEHITRGWNCQVQRFHRGDADAPNGSRVFSGALAGYPVPFVVSSQHSKREQAIEEGTVASQSLPQI